MTENADRESLGRGPSPIPYVSLFTGAMGLDLGLVKAGFKPVVGNEIDPAAVATIRYNRPRLPVVTDSIACIDSTRLAGASGRDLFGIGLVAGGPPCQPFSVFGRRQGVKDQRGALLFDFVRLVLEFGPATFLLENVRGLHSMPLVQARSKEYTADVAEEDLAHGALLREIIRQFECGGYRVDCFLVNVVNYGGPQIRERLLCIGNRYDLRASFPSPQFSNRPVDGLPPFRVLGDAIGPGFIDPDPTLMNFSNRKLGYLALVPSGGNWRSLPVDVQRESMGKSWYLKGGRSAYWRKLSFDFPSPTVVTMPNHAGTSMCHPAELRALTVGECAAIQEFPRDWAFIGSPADKYRLIGNAVPVRLGTLAGHVIRGLLGQIAMHGLRPVPIPTVPSTIQHIRPHVRTRRFWRAGETFAGTHSYYEDAGELLEESTANATR